MSTLPFRCGCGRPYDAARWAKLPLVGYSCTPHDAYGPEEHLEYKNCPCRSTKVVAVGPGHAGCKLVRTARDRTRASRALEMQRLALKAIRGDVEAAMVLGDEQQERGGTAIPTGRVRRVPFVLDADAPNRLGGITVAVPVREIVTGLDRFAAEPSHRTWSQVKVSYVTLPRDVYRQLRARGLFPRRVGHHEVGRRFGDLQWEPHRSVSPSEISSWGIFDSSVRTRLDNPIYVGSITRDNVSGPRETSAWSLQRVRPSRPLPDGH